MYFNVYIVCCYKIFYDCSFSQSLFAAICFRFHVEHLFSLNFVVFSWSNKAVPNVQ